VDLIRDDMEIDWDQYDHEPETHNVRSAAEFSEETINAFYPQTEEEIVERPLWDKCNGKIAFRPGEVSLWAGVNGHGKSMMLSQVTIDLMKQGKKILSCSMEMLPVRQMQRMSRQAFADDKPTPDFIKRLHAWSDGHLWMYDRHGSVEWKRLMAVLRYSEETFGINHFIVDSLMKCVRGEEDYDSQKNFVDELCAFAQARKVHVHLVHHVRKGESEHKAPGKFDVRGAGAITDQVDNVFIVWRNKKIEDDPEKLATIPGALLVCEKQRHGEFEGQLGFWFHAPSMQYLETPDAHPVRYELKEIPKQKSNYGYRADIE